MSLQSLYNISELTDNGDEFSARICFDPGHSIFKGHFPGQPVVPGVCLIRIIKDMVSDIKKKKVVLASGSNIKFLNIIDPHKHPEIVIKGVFMTSTEAQYNISVSIEYDSMIFCKFRGSFQ